MTVSGLPNCLVDGSPRVLGQARPVSALDTLFYAERGRVVCLAVYKSPPQDWQPSSSLSMGFNRPSGANVW
jgi:hypothetical protein